MRGLRREEEFHAFETDCIVQLHHTGGVSAIGNQRGSLQEACAADEEEIKRNDP